jgi:hypothetical protein
VQEGDEEMPVFNEDPDESDKNFGLQNTVGSLLGNVRAVASISFSLSCHLPLCCAE